MSRIYDEAGWVRIGVLCTAGRRSLWVRTPEGPREPGKPDQIELCAGREGDDNYVLIDENNPQFKEILGVIMGALFAAET